jgi:two-component system sensor histidine kinase KdpD
MNNSQENNTLNRNLIIACIKDHPKAMTLLRVARSRAQAINGRWCAVFVETPAQMGLVESSAQERMLRLLTLAEQMGGEASHIEAVTVEKGIAHLLETEKDRIALLIIGNNTENRKWGKLHASVWENVANLARKQHVSLEIVPLTGQTYRRTWRERLYWLRPLHVLYALIAVGCAYGCASLLQRYLSPALFRINNQNIGLLFMAACAFVASRFGLLPGLVASVASFLSINYFFTAPYYLTNLKSVTDILNMGIFLSAALLISLFTSQTRGYAEKSAKRELGTQALFALYRIASVASSKQQALEKLQQKLTRMLQMDVAFFFPPTKEAENMELTYPPRLTLNPADHEALELCWKEAKTTGLASPLNPGAKWRFEPMMATNGEVGALGVNPRKRTQLDAWFGRLLTSIADQTAAIIEHIELEQSMEATRIREEREKLRSMLLSSVSHDLKTPLASIAGALNIYHKQGQRLSPEKRQILIETALQETERLDSFITNILDMTRLESGKIEFKQDWYDAQSLIRDVMKRLDHRMRQHKVVVNLHPAKDVEVYMDLMMLEQVLQNILDNACKYTAAGTLIEITCSGEEGKEFYCSVRDNGAGIPPEKLERVFDKYARLQKKDSQVAGTGLGLAITKAIMEAHGGSIIAANHPEGGAVFTLSLPKWRKTTQTKYVA